jgi:hypothetical protein
MRGYRLRVESLARREFGSPPLSLIEPQLDYAPNEAGGHWYWQGRENLHREPVVHWRPVEHVPAVLYPVVRALYCHLRGEVPRGAGLLSECGVIWCVNPHHWHLETRAERNSRIRVVIHRDFGF